MKASAVLAGGVFFALSSFGQADVSSVVCTSRQPWDGKVDVDVTVANAEADAEYVVSLALVLSDGTEKPIDTLANEPVVKGDGTHTIVWDAAADYPKTRFAGAAVKATLTRFDGSQGVYLVFDLSEGKDSASYPHHYALHGPDLSNDVCRTTELWMRRIPAGTFMCGNSACVAPDESTLIHTYLPYHEVRLTKPYYIGVFEVTQQQYYLMEGSWPSYFEVDRSTRPLEKISLQGFRGGNSQNGWYDDTPLDASPLKRLRAKTGFERLDLPSAAQWERANRAGLQNKYSRPEMTDANASAFSRNSQNVIVKRDDATSETPASQGGTAKVGSFAPNPWGLYDMDGNVWELCTSGHPYVNTAKPVFADYAGAPYVDPLGPTPEWCARTGKTPKDAAGATMCGGSWTLGATSTSVYYRNAVARSLSGGSIYDCGIRLCITCK